MKKIITFGIKYIKIYLILITIYILSLTLSSSIPNDILKEQVVGSTITLQKEGTIPNIYLNISLDNYTDALMINTAYSIDEQEAFKSSMLNRKDYIPGQSMITTNEPGNTIIGLINIIKGKVTPYFEYCRYWHGYLIYLRPLLTCFELQQIRIVLLILGISLMILLAKLIRQKLGNQCMFIIIISFLGMGYPIISISLQYMPVFFISIIFAIVILLKNGKINNIGVMFFIIGSLTSFFDLLTVPILTLGVPLLIYMLLNEEIPTNKKVKLIINWFLGFVSTWLTKWLIIDLIYHKDVILEAVRQALYRSSNDITGIEATWVKEGYKLTYFDTIIENTKYMLLPMILLIINLISQNIYAYKNKLKTRLDIKSLMPYIIITILPLIYYLFMQNHSYIHARYTYRNLMLTMLGMQIINAEMLGIKFEKYKQEKNI